MKPIALALGLILAGPAAADWTATDTALQLAGATALAVDYLQTVELSRRAQRDPCWTEINPILGPRPTTGEVTAYFAGALVLHAGVAVLLPKPWRTIWQASWVTVETGFVAHNLRLGVGLRVPW